jgi:NADPH-dependent 2,4-dienoyl-CoA reductase/sulfur reductase-like enzyme
MAGPEGATPRCTSSERGALAPIHDLEVMVLTERLIVIGGDAAGMSAAAQARRRRGPEDLEVVAFERGHYTSYSACGIPYFVGEVVDAVDDLVVRTPLQFRDNYSIDVRIRQEVTAIDLEKGAVQVHDLEKGTEGWEGYDALMIATGAAPIRPDWPGSDGRGLFGVQVLDDGVAIRKAVEERDPHRAVVVGGGYVGLEMTEAFVKRGMDVALVEMAAQPMSTLDPDMGALITDAVRDLGVDVYLEEQVDGFETSDGHIRAVVTNHRTLPADIVVLGLGVTPNVALGSEAGIPTGPSGAICVDRRMRAQADGVWSAGDCAEKFHLVSRRPVVVPLGTHANKEGRVAGINIGGGYETFPGVIGTAASKVCEMEVARTGLKEDEAVAAGFEPLAVVVDSSTRASYYPGAASIKTKLIVERVTGRLLGAQIIGREGAAKRIDVLATALWNEMTVGDMLNMDLSYAPPFSPVWDAVLIAARKAWQAVEDNLP